MLLGYSAFAETRDEAVVLCKHSQMKLLTLAGSDGAWQAVGEGRRLEAGGGWRGVAHDTS